MSLSELKISSCIFWRNYLKRANQREFKVSIKVIPGESQELHDDSGC